jgi:hypothetical protein
MAYNFSRPRIDVEDTGNRQSLAVENVPPSDDDLNLLRGALVTFTSECCQSLASTSPPLREWLVPKQVDENSWRTDRTTRLANNFSISVDRDGPTYVAVAHVIDNSEALRQYFAANLFGVLEDFGSRAYWISQRLHTFIHEYLRRVFNVTEGFNFESTIFTQMFGALRQELVSPTLRRVALTPLVALVVS